MAELNTGTGSNEFRNINQENGARDRIDRAREPAADTLHGAADALRDRATGLPGGEKIAGAARGAADALDSSAGYLKTHDASEMMQDLLSFVKRHPAAALVAVGAVGFVIAAALRRN
jgi:hypothetical protein